MLLLVEEAITSFRGRLTALREQLADIESEMLLHTRPGQVAALAAVRQELVGLRRAVAPYALAVAASEEVLLARDGLDTDRRPVLRAHCRAVAGIERAIAGLLDSTAHALDLYRSLVSTRQNALINRLTILSALFLPLNFITGFFGMNFAALVDNVASTWAFWCFGLALPALTVACVAVVLRRAAAPVDS